MSVRPRKFKAKPGTKALKGRFTNTIFQDLRRVQHRRFDGEIDPESRDRVKKQLARRITTFGGVAGVTIYSVKGPTRMWDLGFEVIGKKVRTQRAFLQFKRFAQNPLFRLGRFLLEHKTGKGFMRLYSRFEPYETEVDISQFQRPCTVSPRYKSNAKGQ